MNLLNIKVSYVTLSNWSNKFSPYFKLKIDKLKLPIDLQFDDCHAYETIIFINYIKHHLLLVINSETRFIISSHLTKCRNYTSAFSLVNESKKYGSQSYNQ